MKYPIIHRKLVKVLLRKRADAKTAANEREPAIRLRALGVLGVPALSPTLANVREYNLLPSNFAILAERKRAR